MTSTKLMRFFNIKDLPNITVSEELVLFPLSREQQVEDDGKVMSDSVRELAYKLWQIRSMKGVQTTQEQDWYDAENMIKQKIIPKELIEESLETNDQRQIFVGPNGMCLHTIPGIY